MRHVIALSFATVALTCAHAREGIPFHTKSPISTEPVAPERPFTPSRGRFARMLVQKQFRIVTSLEAVDPAVRRLWFRRYPRNEIATGNQEFAETDISDGKPFRFVLADQAGETWFILFETGGLLHHHTLVFFQRAGRHYRVAEAAYGNLRRNTFESCVEAIRKGKFVQTDDLAPY
ncbi:MAG TPA: hypothetical protein VFA61_08995 [Candidatus Udaeobacter sp.]|nr:hypothetical protein [Candidatus Udaeobacter sp.]